MLFLLVTNSLVTLEIEMYTANRVEVGGSLYILAGDRKVYS